jgi:hypothetical protein
MIFRDTLIPLAGLIFSISAAFGAEPPTVDITVAAAKAAIQKVTNDCGEVNGTGIPACSIYADQVRAVTVKYFVEAQHDVLRSSCTSDNWKLDLGIATRLEELADSMGKVISFAAQGIRIGEVSTVTGRIAIEKISDVGKASLRNGAEMVLTTGQNALKAGCSEVADEHYRYVLVHYTHDWMASFRQRAQVGIDDVRARKSGFGCRVFGNC